MPLLSPSEPRGGEVNMQLLTVSVPLLTMALDNALPVTVRPVKLTVAPAPTVNKSPELTAASTVTPAAGPVTVVSPVKAAKFEPVSTMVRAVAKKVGSKVMTSAPGLAFAFSTACRSEPGPLLLALVTMVLPRPVVKVATLV